MLCQQLLSVHNFMRNSRACFEKPDTRNADDVHPAMVRQHLLNIDCLQYI
jgi:hypothetical protein